MELSTQVGGRSMQQVQAQQLEGDLSRSGLQSKDIGAYLAQESELAAVGLRPHMYLDTPGVGTPGYVIPYYDINGNRAPFYRVKLFRPLPRGARYLQPANTGSWVYFPRTFKSLLESTLEGKSRSVINGFNPCIIICEGEKKAAKACAEGFLTIALGGVYNWRTRVMILPKGTALTKNNDGEIIARVGTGVIETPTTDRRAVLAAGLPEVIQLAKQFSLQVIIAFDTDEKENIQVQQACAELAFELRTAGISADHIRQLTLPAPDKTKVGLDDYLVSKGPEALSGILHDLLLKRSAYPRHPNLRALISSRLEIQMSRNDARELSLLILSDMDTCGIRMMESSTGAPHYFDGRSKSLMAVNLLHHHSEPLHESKFGEFLYHTYDLAQSDNKLLTWVAAGFTGEKPVGIVEPKSVLALMGEDKLAYQINDSSFAIISGDPATPIRIVDNGSEGILFRADQVEPIDWRILEKEFHRQVVFLKNPSTKFEDLFWPAAVSQFKFAKPSDAKVMSVLMYMSPWFLRWKGTQLPVELMVGEPGSGKSSIYALRLQILNGRATLRNQPTDIRDWYASITSQSGLHVIDNLHFATKEIRQRLSDEMCRIVTEPAPFVEMRRLFTTSEVARIPVQTVFAATSIQQPFINADILQRSVIFEVHAVGNNHDSDWAGSQLRARGGREVWLAQQLAAVHLFLQQAGQWNQNFKSAHRLANFEQMFAVMSRIVKLPDSTTITQELSNVAESQVSEYDWTMEALKDFAFEILPVLQKDPRKIFTCQDIATWAGGREDYCDNQMVTNARKLTRYIDSHLFMVEKCSGIFKTGSKYGNRVAFRAQPIKTH